MRRFWFILFGGADKEEGFRAFFKGGPARVLRSSPQFGFTLLGEYIILEKHRCSSLITFRAGYETLKTYVSVDLHTPI